MASLGKVMSSSQCSYNFSNTVNKRVQNAVLEYNLENDSMISVCFQGTPFNIMVIQVYTLTKIAEEAEVEQLYEDLLELIPPQNTSFSS